MRSFLKEIADKFVEIESNACECGGNVVESMCESCGMDYNTVDEQNVTGAIAGYNVPGAFTTVDRFKKKKFKYESVNTPSTHKQVDKHTLHVEDIMEKKYAQLIEGYKDFKSGDIKPSSKVKSTIQEIAKKLQEIETLVNYNSKLKEESGVTSTAYGPGTQKALTKISERLIKISERIRSLGA